MFALNATNTSRVPYTKIDLAKTRKDLFPNPIYSIRFQSKQPINYESVLNSSFVCAYTYSILPLYYNAELLNST